MEFEVLAILMGGGGHKKFPPFKRGGGMNGFTLSQVGLGGGGQKVSDPRFSHFVASPPRN